MNKLNRHALIDSKTGLVRNIIVWDGRAFLPPADHYVVNQCDGQIGDYWHQDSNLFYTPSLKRRVIDAMGKVMQQELTPEEKEHIEPRLIQIYDHAKRVFNINLRPDLTQVEHVVPT